MATQRMGIERDACRHSSELCCAPQDNVYQQHCFWAFVSSEKMDLDGPSLGHERPCGHRWIALDVCCVAGTVTKLSDCYKIKEEINKLNSHLDVARKALKIFAIYHDQKAKAIQSKDKTREEDCTLIWSALLRDQEISDVRNKYHKYFDMESGNTEKGMPSLEGGWTQMKEYLEGTPKERSDGRLFAGDIAKVLHSHFKERQAKKHPGETALIWIDTRATESPCHPLYCDQIPLEQMPDAEWKKLTFKFGEKYSRA